MNKSPQYFISNLATNMRSLIPFVVYQLSTKKGVDKENDLLRLKYLKTEEERREGTLPYLVINILSLILSLSHFCLLKMLFPKMFLFPQMVVTFKYSSHCRPYDVNYRSEAKLNRNSKY